MKIYITVTEDPVFITPFLKKVIEADPSRVVGIAIVEGTILEARNQGRLAYLLTLILIFNPLRMLGRALGLAAFRLLESLPALRDRNPLSVARLARRHGIPVRRVATVNDPAFVASVRALEPDLLINQAQVLVKRELLQVPRIGCLNRHGALLPRYRGRLAPFWAYLNGERETGVSIHFLEEKLDSGPIVVQKRISIGRFDSVDSLVRKVFALAPGAMLEAIERLAEDDWRDRLLPNDDEQATYYTSPTFSQALLYRRRMLRRMVLGA